MTNVANHAVVVKVFGENEGRNWLNLIHEEKDIKKVYWVEKVEHDVNEHD